MNYKYSVAVFAHNLVDKIATCIDCIILNEIEVEIFVIANGCRDDTENVVKQLQLKHKNLHLVSIPMADKANAWNHYVHNVETHSELHFFIDGDITIQNDALTNIVKTVEANPHVNIVGGVPSVGRDKQGWIQRMIRQGRVSGGLYALTDSFVKQLKTQRVLIPIGFVGEDFLVSSLAKNMLDFRGFYAKSSKLIIDNSARFSFEPISYRRVSDYFIYFRRMVRYRIRDYQLTLLINSFVTGNLEEIPATINELYEKNNDLMKYYWRGRLTLVDWIAVFIIRNQLFKK